MATTASRRRNRTVLLLAMVLLGLVVGWAMIRGTSDAVPLGAEIQVSGSSAADETITTAGRSSVAIGGTVTGLAPGNTSTLTVTLTNRSPATYRLVELDTTVLDASAACRAEGNVVVSPYRLGRADVPVYVIPLGGTVTVPLAVTFLSSSVNQDACRNATFPLRFTGTATRGTSTQATS